MAVVANASGQVYAGGSFTQASGITVNHVAKWNGSSWQALGPGVNDDVWSIAIANNGDVYIVGDFTLAGNQTVNYVAKWNGSSWSSLGSGLNGPAYDIGIAPNGDIYVVGDFTQAGGISANYVARWNGSSWSSLGSGLNSEAYALAIDAVGNVYLGGSFTQAGSIGTSRIAKWNGNTFFALGSGLNNNCYTIHISATGMVYAGGDFTQAGGQNAFRIAQWNGGTWSNLGTGLNFWCLDITTDPMGNIYAGGLFTLAGNSPANYLAQWDGSSWSELGGGTDDWVYSLWHNGSNTLYAAGEFIYAGGILSNYVAQWTTQDPPPGCTFLQTPSNGSTNVPRTAILAWNPVGNADGYLLTVGTCPSCTDIANNLNVGTSTIYDPPGLLPCLSTIYVTITPYNQYGSATGCYQESFTTVGVSASTNPSQFICGNDSVQLTASGGVQYRWSPAEGLSNPYVAEPWASPSTTTTYTVTVFDFNGCSDTASTTVYVLPGPTVSVSTTDETAYGAQDGTATAIATGGTTPYTYQWQTGDTSATITGLAPGIYTVTVTDAQGCAISASGVVDSFVCPELILLDSVNHPFCSDSCTGSIQILDVSNATPPLTYTWNTGDSTNDLTQLCAGLYTLTLTDATNCSTVDSFLLIDTVDITVSAMATPETGYQFHDGTATVTYSGGISPWLISWNTGDTTATIDSLAPGTYWVIVTDLLGCFATDTVVVDSFTCPPVQIHTAITHATCPTLCNGVASIDSVVGAAPPLTYFWQNGDSTGTADSLCAGIWTVSVTDSLHCTWVDTIAIVDTIGLTVQFNVQHESANQAQNGSIEASVYGGVPPYQFLWNTGDSTALIDSLSPGTYVLTVTDAGGCSLIDSALVLAFDCNELSVNAQITDVSCAGSCEGQVTISSIMGGFAPYTFLWSNGDQATTADSLCAGTVFVTITDSLNCSITDTFSIGEPPTLQLILTATDETGFGFQNGTASAFASGGTPPYTYTWSTGDTTAQIFNLAPGWYTLTLTDAHGCTQTDSIEIAQFVCPNMSGQYQLTVPTCHDACDGAISVIAMSAATPPISYLWSTGDTTATVQLLCAGIYALTVTDSLNCTYLDSILVAAPPPLVVSATSTPETAYQANDGTATVQASGGTPPYSYLWNTGDTTQQIGPIAPGVYSVTVTDVHGCTDSTEVVIDEFGCLPLTTFATISHMSCNSICDGSISIDSVVNAQAPLHFIWNTGDTTATLGSLCAGTYSVTVTDQSNCTSIGAFEIEEPPAIILELTATHESSNGAQDGSVSAEILSGGVPPFSFTWHTGDTTTTISPLAPGWYYLTLTDSQGCTVIDSVEVLPFICPTLEIAFTIDSISCANNCDGHILISEVTSGVAPFTYMWSNNSTQPELSGLCAGTWTVTVTDAVNCSVIDSVSLLSPAPLIPNATATPETAYQANDGTATVAPQGGTPPYEVLWSTGDSTFTINSLSPGNYTVLVTDARGCTAFQMVIVLAFECPDVDIQINQVAPTCTDSCNGMATVIGMTNGVAPFNYEWNTGDTSSTLYALCEGIYYITMTDSKNCTDTDSAILIDPLPLTLEVITTDETGYLLADGTAQVIASGGIAPYSYSWSTGINGTSMVTGLAPGWHEVTVVDGMGCVTIDSFFIEPFLCDSIWVDLSLDSASCANSCDGSIQIDTVHNATPPYTYHWNTNDTTAYLANVCAGTYWLTITDATNCMWQDSIIIESPPRLLAYWSSIGQSAPSQSDGQISVTVSGGVPPYHILWHTGDTSWTLNELLPGNYSFTITDGVGCTTADTVIVQPFTCYELQVLAQATTTNCPTCQDGTAWAQPLNGMPPFAWLWSNGSTDSLITLLPPGTYGVTITDAYGCTGIDSVVVDSEPCYELQVLAQATAITCPTCQDGTAWAQPLNGMPPFAWLWSNGSTDSLITLLPPGTYGVTITDAYGCTGIDSVVVETPPVVTLEILPFRIKIFPNPFEDELWIQIDATAPDVHLQIYDVRGKSIMAPFTMHSGQQQRLPLSDLPQGVYMLVMKWRADRYFVPLVKQ